MSIRIIGPDDPIPAEARGATVALGNFDGVHLGHAAVLRAAHAARPDAPLAVLTFEPHPREFFRPDDPPFRLTLLAEKAAALADLNVGWLFVQSFDHAFSQQSAEYFALSVLHERLGARHLICGADFAFGHRRGGDVAFLAAKTEVLGIGLSIAPAFSDVGGPISSTRIRRLLQDGYPERANGLLGRPWSIREVVAHGDKRGRTIGLPDSEPAARAPSGAGARGLRRDHRAGRWDAAQGRCQYRPPSDSGRYDGEPAGGEHLRFRRRPL